MAKGKKIYFLAFHVDYWNRLGWEDRFSSPEFSERQQQYAVRMSKRLIYTPQFIVNGTEEFAGDDSRTLYSMISDALQKAPVSALALTVHVEGGSIGVRYKTGKTLKNTSLLVALIQKEDSTRIKRGENWGRFLHHVQIVRQAKAVKLYNNQGTTKIYKPDGFNTKNWEVIGLIQNDSTGVINAASKADFKQL
ncbi:DUF1223 domain-containing protein [Flavobacterium limnosediminis]|nr:DUF1223 domain-containing protein [Flavobacterium limnosediminis]